MARVGRESDVDGLPRGGLVHAVGAVVILDVAGAAFRRERFLDIPAALEFREDRLVRQADDVGEHV